MRLPRQPQGTATIDKEVTWLPYVADRVTADVPTVIGVGEPDLGYPERWAVTTWLHGRRPTAAHCTPPGSTAHRLAEDLGGFSTELRDLQVPARARDDAALSWYRGRPLWHRDADFRDAALQCRQLGTELDLGEALRVWDRAVEASRDAQPAGGWYHGDLLAENLLLDDRGGLAAVITFPYYGATMPDRCADRLAMAHAAIDEPGRA